MRKFAAFILTHGRPDNVITHRALRRQGYTGDIYLLVDNEDETLPDYKARYGDTVIVFDKAAVSDTFDEGDNFGAPRNAVVYARNAAFMVANDLGLDYFVQLDDDYRFFAYRFRADLSVKHHMIKNLDAIFEIILDYFEDCPQALTMAMGQGGDMQGGDRSSVLSKLALKRKAMNSFFCDVRRPFKFVGRINEDVNTYVTLGNRGNLIFSFFNVYLRQNSTQHSRGGMTELYLDVGTYRKSFYTVMYAPSCVRVAEMGVGAKRLHHSISWRNAVPVIMSEDWRKP